MSRWLIGLAVALTGIAAVWFLSNRGHKEVPRDAAGPATLGSAVTEATFAGDSEEVERVLPAPVSRSAATTISAIEDDGSPSAPEEENSPERDAVEREYRFQEAVSHYETLPETSESRQMARNLSAAFLDRFAAGPSSALSGASVGNISCRAGMCSVEVALASQMQSKPLVSIARQTARDIGGDGGRPLLSSFSMDGPNGETLRRVYYHIR